MPLAVLGHTPCCAYSSTDKSCTGCAEWQSSDFCNANSLQCTSDCAGLWCPDNQPTPPPTPGPAPTPPPAPAPPAPTPAADSGFVTTSGGKFRYQGKQFGFGGGNWYKMSYQFYPAASQADQDTALAHLDLAVSLNMKVIRTWAFMAVGTENQDPNGPANAQTYMGDKGCWYQYFDMAQGRPVVKESCMVALDRLLLEAAKRKLFLVLPVINNWEDLGGMAQYLYWRFYNDSSHNNPYNYGDFYTDPIINGWYQDYIKAVVNRVNTLTGVPYKSDPTILAWELMNEPRSGGSTRGPNVVRPNDPKKALTDVSAWVKRTSDFIKSLDANHLVTTGAEGFFNRPPSNLYVFQGGEGWDQDVNSAFPSIDYLAVHFYPSSWGLTSDELQSWYLGNQTALAQKLGKPVVLEEFPVSDLGAMDRWLGEFLAGGGNGFQCWDLDLPAGAGDVLAKWALKYSASGNSN